MLGGLIVIASKCAVELTVATTTVPPVINGATLLGLLLCAVGGALMIRGDR
ncbi:MAG: hypothetical protein AB7T06_40775 [Kofleriaceae bacterium]